jgi:two-component system sensor histidine kinase ChvG
MSDKDPKQNASGSKSPDAARKPHGEWATPLGADAPDPIKKSSDKGYNAIDRSPLVRKIIVFNLLGLLLLVAGVLYLNPFRDSLVKQREQALVLETELITAAYAAQLRHLKTDDGLDQQGASVHEYALLAALDDIEMASCLEIFIYGAQENLLAHSAAQIDDKVPDHPSHFDNLGPTYLMDFYNNVSAKLSDVFVKNEVSPPPLNKEHINMSLMASALNGQTQVISKIDGTHGTVFFVASPIMDNDDISGVMVNVTRTGEIDPLVRYEQEKILQVFLIATFVSIALSMVLASTIATPLTDLVAAVEASGGVDHAGSRNGRISIPDLTARNDEIGRLSGGLRGMVAALYDRIDLNEQFAADVAHEIKNPLASLRSAVGTLEVSDNAEHRGKLLDVIKHDVRRLDRLVSDIANASRLDSELVKEEQENFDLTNLVRNLSEHFAVEGKDKGVELATDLPKRPIRIYGLEARLAQVFVNLITNALSFCSDGDKIRVWLRANDNRILVVIEDTGPGIPEQALSRIFDRFYSERPMHQFGDNSGLGLAISKQIIEAHGGVIWAENIRPVGADIASKSIGARFVVGLPFD